MVKSPIFGGNNYEFFFFFTFGPSKLTTFLLLCAYQCILMIKDIDRWEILKVLPKLDIMNIQIHIYWTFQWKIGNWYFPLSASRLGLCNCRYCIYELFEVNICFNLNELLQLIWNFANIGKQMEYWKYFFIQVDGLTTKLDNLALYFPLVNWTFRHTTQFIRYL